MTAVCHHYYYYYDGGTDDDIGDKKVHDKDDSSNGRIWVFYSSIRTIYSYSYLRPYKTVLNFIFAQNAFDGEPKATLCVS